MKRTGLGKGISALFSDEALNEIEPKNERNRYKFRYIR